MLFNLSKKSLSEVNTYLTEHIDNKNNKRNYTISNPNGLHAICAGLNDIYISEL